MEINNKKFSKKDLTIIILVVLGILLCIFGLMDKIFEHTVFNFFKNLTRPYLDKTYKESLLKGAADVIEGSTVNVNMILGMQIEVGDIIQPVSDMINIIWKISLASVVVLKIQTIYQEIFRVKLATILIFTSLVSYLPYTVFKNSVTEIFKKISKYAFFVLIYIYAVIPGTIFVNSMISNYFEKEYKTPAIVHLNQNLAKLNNVKDSMLSLDQNKSIFNIPGQIDSAKQKINNFSTEINNVSHSIMENAPIIIGILLLTSIVFPLLLMILLYKLTKSIIFEKILKS